MTDETTTPMDGTQDPAGRRVTKREVRVLPMPLTNEQRLDLDAKIGKLGVSRKDAGRVEDEAKEAHKAAREARERLDDEIASLALLLGTGVDEAEVDVEVEFMLGTNTIRVWRLDTGQVIEERAATAEERQAELELVAPAPSDERCAGDGAASVEPTPPKRRRGKQAEDAPGE